MRQGISKALTNVVQEINKVAEDKGDLNRVRQSFSDEGYKALNLLVNNTGFFTTSYEYRLTLLGTPSGKYEVRGITGRVKMGATEGEPVQELVFALNWQGYIIDVHFAMDSFHYQTIISHGTELKDGVYREHILNFLEQFRTAHNTKNIDFIEKTYSDDALIIVGRVVTKKTDAAPTPWIGSNGHRIEFIKKSKKTYVSALRDAFQRNSFVKVMYDSVRVRRHPKVDKIYGITLKQRWNSSTYGDEGYLFIMMDFRLPDTPLIRVRSWQPEKFDDGTTVNLGDFLIP